MKLNILVIFFLVSSPSYLLSSEPSAFGAGDLNKPVPYGLTSSEKIILENSKKLQTVVVKSNNQANEVESLKDRIDGLQTIVDNMGAVLRESKLKLKEIDEKNNINIKSNSEFNHRITNANQQNSKITLANTENIEKTNLLVGEISKIVDKINSTYVTKEEFNVLVRDINEFKDLIANELKSETKSKKNKIDNMTNADIMKSAKEFYDKKQYLQSLEYYDHLIAKKYKTATSNYMAGENSYYLKKYSEAIGYFKKSATLDADASYMSVLILHTAISMDETGDKNNAKIFYNAVISKYPDSESAKTAKKKLK